MTSLPTEHLELIKRILSDKYHLIQLKSIAIIDDLQSCHICLTLLSGETLEGAGVGMVAAIFSALKNFFIPQYESLNSLELTKFFVNAKGTGPEAEVEVELQIRNSYGKYFHFKDISRSLVASSARVSTAVIEFFINSEQAFLVMHKALQNARERGRDDLVVRYEAELALLVQSTSYTYLIDKVRDSLGK